MDRNRITRTAARAPGVERLGSLARRCLTRASSLTQSRKYTVKAVGTKDEGKPEVGQAPSDIPALKPYWGKPAVRNFRGGNGNVGIIRSPVRAIALPDIHRSLLLVTTCEKRILAILDTLRLVRYGNLPSEHSDLIS